MIREADDTLTIYERSKPGRRAFVAPALDVPERSPDELLPPDLRRAEPPRLPEVAEPEIVRHYNRLSKRNFDLDTGFYPLGSCTMKHNPKLHERIAALPGHARMHPLQDPSRVMAPPDQWPPSVTGAVKLSGTFPTPPSRPLRPGQPWSVARVCTRLKRETAWIPPSATNPLSRFGRTAIW